MRTCLILARHGNTFKPEDVPVWVGARSDLPLVAKGMIQAQALADALIKAKIDPLSISAGPLLRTRQMAAIIAQKLKRTADAVHIDVRLREIDYGTWEGKSTSEIEAMGGRSELVAWNKNGIFPTHPGWSPDEGQILNNIRAVLAEAKSGTSLLITSNGILRFFARLALNADAFPDRKVSTGHVCIMELHGEDWRILQWNSPPEKIFDPIPS